MIYPSRRSQRTVSHRGALNAAHLCDTHNYFGNSFLVVLQRNLIVAQACGQHSRDLPSYQFQIGDHRDSFLSQVSLTYSSDTS